MIDAFDYLLDTRWPSDKVAVKVPIDKMEQLSSDWFSTV